MTEIKAFPGSRWWKIDFHTHTPASNNDYKDTTITPEVWLQRARDAGLDGIVVTDHNSGGWIDRLKSVNNTMNQQDGTRPLIIFPGVEINVADSSSRVHLLAVFDPSCDSQKITAVLGSCGITSDFGNDETTSTSTGFVDTVGKIKAANGIPIPAHIDIEKGLLHNHDTMPVELRKSLTQIYAAEFCDPNVFDQAHSDLRSVVDSLAKVGGSDAHNIDEIGRYFTWLKMSRPTIEGMRLALQDHQYCVKNQNEDPNTLPDIYLKQLSIINMHHCGRIPGKPCVVQLHPHFNAFIGGRGSGKSTIIESIRIVSRRDDELKDKLREDLEKFKKLAQNKEGVMLSSTELLLEIQRRSKTYRLRWQQSGQGLVVEEWLNDVWQGVDEGNIKERFPLRIYSQKQIYALASNPRGLLDIMDHSDEINRVEWTSRWKSTESRFLELRVRQRELHRQLAKESELRTKLKDIENDIRDYEEKGHGEILKLYQKLSQQKNTMPSDALFIQLSQEIRKLADKAALSDFPFHLFDLQDQTTQELQAIHDEAVNGVQQIALELKELAEKVDILKQQRHQKTLASQWFQSVQVSEKAYQGLVYEYADKGHATTMADYGKWVDLRGSLNQELLKMDALRNEMNDVQQEITALQNKFLELRQELLEKRKKFLAQVIGSNEYVRMELVPFGDVSSVEEEYRNILGLAGGIFADWIYNDNKKQSMLYQLVQWEIDCSQESQLTDRIAKIKTNTRQIAEGKISEGHANFNKRLKDLLENKPANFDQLDLWWPEDFLIVKYNRDPGEKNKFEPLEKGSAGQKAAAILAFLLSYGTEPMIIDQPEDDLDNALVYDLIVRQIHKNKLRRQLIIVTHNPNIVVNADAELVHVMAFKGLVKVDQQGGLEEQSIRNAICDIMEGGREAFKKRYDRLALEPSHV
ncbi:MAG: histidinol phosphatase [Magnetococcales bacterium]|nr:histidinol phosphatase [Magnetococcales bacterium]MBF0322399.1 histidinol phosphatase [Magnetococcales bacterium]